MSWLEGTRARLRLLFARRSAESRMDEEIRFHIEMETNRLVRESALDPKEARRRALVTFGGVEQHKEALREGRGLAWLGGLSLDLKLGLRMLVKYPGLTVVGVIGMSVAVAIGAVSFGIIYTFVDPTLPLDEGDRVVAIESIDPTGGAGQRTHLHDLAVWRETLSAVELVGAYRTIARNLITGDRPPEPVRIAEMTASGFRVARVPPLLGRYLLDGDERKGAPPVVVIGYDVWQRRFAGDSAIAGHTIQLGATRRAIVGVMPEGFGFPVSHRVWTPLQLDPLDFERGGAPVIQVFGRLAPTATLEEAQTQVTTITQRLASEHPETHSALRTRVMPYALYFIGGSSEALQLQSIQVLVSMLLVLVGTNVAILVYARTANRAGEIAVRSALGASRGRIVAQLFAEALVLSAAAAAVGLVFARFSLQQVDAFMAGERWDALPFWMNFGMSPGVVLYSAGLAVLAAVIVGVVPGLKATRHRVHAGLQQLGMGGSGMRLGKSWTVLIVAQVAAAVAILPVAFHLIHLVVHAATGEPAVATRGLLTATLRLDRADAGADDVDGSDDEEFMTRFAQRQAELVRRLEAEPGVANVLLVDGRGDDWTSIEIEGAGAAAGRDSASASSPARYPVGIDLVDPDYFETFEIPLVAGRRFQPGDVSGSAKVAIVEQAVVRQAVGAGAGLGLRVRPFTRASEPGSGVLQSEPWYEIVGVVADPARSDPSGERRPRMYLPLLPAEVDPSRLLVQVRSDDPASFAGRLRELTVTVDPMLRLEEVELKASTKDEEALFRLVALVVVGVAASILLLSAAGIYALMSFTVTRRRREIGIRSALGAGPRHVAASVLSRAAGQIVLGIVIGTVLAGVLVRVIGSVSSLMRDLTWVAIVGLLVAVAVVMTVVGLAAALGPARRALQIQPTEALRSE